MIEPKRAEPANEHAANLRKLSSWYRIPDEDAKRLNAAAAEIERLAARVRELQEALTMKAFCEPEVSVIPRSDRPWRPIESAPRDGTRVELWCEFVRGSVASYGRYQMATYGKCWLLETGYPVSPTHWRPEPAGPESKPDQETKGER